MLSRAYEAQCAAVDVHCADTEEHRRRALTLLSLAFGSFCIGTTEFASMGILQLFSDSLGVSLSSATNAITAYAFGVVIGAPAVTLAAAAVNRRPLLLALMALFVVGNILSALAASLGMFAIARFITGLPQGAYFGAGAVVASYIVGPGHGGKAFAMVMTGLTIATIVGSPLATFLGQGFGWRNTYMAVAGLGLISFSAIWLWVPRTEALNGGPIKQELVGLRKRSVWMMILVAAGGVGSIFAVYTFIGPLVTDVVRLEARWIPVALSLFGLGMTAGNIVGGRLADRNPSRGIIIGFGSAVVVLALVASFGSSPLVLFPGLFLIGGNMMTAIPTIQVRLTRFAPEAPTLMGAMNLAALNVANAVGAWSGSLTIANGWGPLSAAWAGCALTVFGLAAFLLSLGQQPRLVATQ